MVFLDQYCWCFVNIIACFKNPTLGFVHILYYIDSLSDELQAVPVPHFPKQCYNVYPHTSPFGPMWEVVWNVYSGPDFLGQRECMCIV